jgi:hypothetical protein
LQNRNFTRACAVWSSFRAKGSEISISQFYSSFWPWAFTSCERVAPEISKSQFYTSLTLRPHFVRKCCVWNFNLAILQHFLAFDFHFVRKGDAAPKEIRISPHVCTCRHAWSPQKVAAGQEKFAFHHTFVCPTRGISTEGCSRPRQIQIRISPRVCASDTHDLCSRVPVAFRKPPPGCPCRRKTWEVGVLYRMGPVS